MNAEFFFSVLRFSRARDDLVGESTALSSLLSPTHSLSFPLRISQRDQQRRKENDGSTEEDGGRGDERQCMWKMGGARAGRHTTE